MAIVLPGPLVADIRGQIGGLVWARNRGGLYCRNNTSPTQPRTTEQQLVRSLMTTVMQTWSLTLTAAQRNYWNDYASITPVRDRFGKKQYLTGINMFARFNAAWTRMGGTLLTTAPAVPGEGPMLVPTLTGTVALGVRITAVSPAIGVGSKVAVYRAPAPVTQAKNYYASPFIYTTSLTSASVYPLVIIPPAEMSIGQRWHVRVRYYDSTGKVGPAWVGYADITA